MDKSITPELFDEKDLCEIESDDFPGERLIVCRNPHLAEERKRKHLDLLDMTEGQLLEIQQTVGREKRALRGKEKIGRQKRE